MINDLQALLSQLLPRAISWAETMAADVVANGSPLSSADLWVADAVGVQKPSYIRILTVDRFILPNDPELQTAASKVGLIGPTTTGLTLGHSIMIKNGSMSLRLLSHECRYVHQYERAGSIAEFLTAYLESFIQFGNWDSPFEQDARAHEMEEKSADC